MYRQHCLSQKAIVADIGLMQEPILSFSHPGADWAEKRPANILRLRRRRKDRLEIETSGQRRHGIWCRCGKKKEPRDRLEATQEAGNCCQFLDSVSYPVAGIGAASDSGVFSLLPFLSGRAQSCVESSRRTGRSRSPVGLLSARCSPTGPYRRIDRRR